MDKEQVLKILKRDDHDHEAHHGECDDALLSYINDPEITEAFWSRVKWYA